VGRVLKFLILAALVLPGFAFAGVNAQVMTSATKFGDDTDSDHTVAACAVGALVSATGYIGTCVPNFGQYGSRTCLGGYCDFTKTAVVDGCDGEVSLSEHCTVTVTYHLSGTLVAQEWCNPCDGYPPGNHGPHLTLNNDVQKIFQFKGVSCDTDCVSGSSGPTPEEQNCINKSQDGRTHYFSTTTVQSGCNPDNNCAITVVSGGSSMAGVFDSTGMASYFQGVYSGATCSEPQPQLVEHDGVPLPDGTSGACSGVSSSSGACVTAEKSNCGYVNGEYRCVTSSQLTDQNPCVQTASGGVFCKADAPSQPLAPTNPDGTKKPADVQFQLKSPNGTSTTVNYYGSSTVTTGAENPGNDKGGDESGKGDCGSKNTPCHVVVDGGGSGGGDGDGDGYGDGDGQCSGANCGTSAPGFGGVDDFGTSLAKFVGDIQGSNIAQAMSHVSDAVPTGGSAPSSCFEAFNRQFCYAVPDEVVSAVAPILSLVMKAFWSLVAIVLFMKA
jgi:hypothetical protein